MSFHDGFISQIVGRPAVIERESARQPIGKVADFLVGKPDDAFPQIDGVVVKTKDGTQYAPIGSVRDVAADGTIVLAQPPNEPAPHDERALYVIQDLFDKQIVDVDGRKDVRINDLQVARTWGGALRVVAAHNRLAGQQRDRKSVG
jgi:magnesium transporter